MRVAFGSVAANSWGRRFLRELAAELPAGLADRRQTLARTRDAAQRLFREEPGARLNQKSRLIYALCSLVLAGYREVVAETGDASAAAETVRVAFLRTHQGRVRFLARTFLRLTREPVALLARLPLARFAQKMYGSAMGFGQEAVEGGVDLIVTRCAFHRFFVDHGEPALTRLVCGWDRNWMDVIDASDRPVRVERPSTLSTGGDCCRFRFVRDTGKGPLVDIILPVKREEDLTAEGAEGAERKTEKE